MGVECELIFDGISSKDIGVTVEGFPGAVLAERDFKTESIPGRNGDLLYDYGTYKNYRQSYTVHWRYVGWDARIASWLNQPGYRRFEDSFHPEHFRMAYFCGSPDVDNRMQVLKRMDIDFDFKPQWFRNSGENELTITSGQTLLNTGFESLPIITITGSGSGTLTVGDTSVKFSSIPSTGIVLDCDLQDAYSTDKLNNLNHLITLQDNSFPSFKPGKTTINYSGGVKSVKLKPRWWDLL